MVCLGNICRSPLAEGIMQSKIKDHQLSWEVDSAGTSAYHSGEKPDSRSIEIAFRNGIDISEQRSRQILDSDFENFDLILVMDALNYNSVYRMAKDINQKKKVKMIMNYAAPDQNLEVPDPYWNNGFDKVYAMLEEACEKIVTSYRP